MASQYDDLIRETRAKLKQGIKPDHAPAAAAKPSEPYDPFPTLEDLEAHGVMDPEARETIKGHAMKTEGQKYGVYPLALLAKELDKFPRFETNDPA
ncbi:MAG: hypothetical protein ABS77_10170 [Phenylobacterium sp. SCN 69-14]|nr:MAG: hypothetical protein ABS77_10170 [Phenylobacterium sp. SCN 69-14]